MAAKQRKANTVPKIAPLLLGEPMISSDFGVSSIAKLAKKLDLASTFKIKMSKARDEIVFGFIKKGWNSLCSNF